MPYLLSGFAVWIANKLFPGLFTALFSIAKDIILWVISQLFDVVASILAGLDVDVSFLDATQYIKALPTEWNVWWNALGFAEAMIIIFSAIILRTSIVVIPFVGRIFK